MKHFIAISLFFLMSFSFLGDTGIFSFQKKTKIESSQDYDSEEDVNEKGEKDKLAFFQSFSHSENFVKAIKANTPLVTKLFRISSEVEIRPPRA